MERRMAGWIDGGRSKRCRREEQSKQGKKAHITSMGKTSHFFRLAVSDADNCFVCRPNGQLATAQSGALGDVGKEDKQHASHFLCLG